MSKKLFFMLTLAVLLSLSTTVLAAPMIWLEAEEGAVEASMKVVDEADTSGGKVVLSEAKEAGSITFEFEIKEAGDYKVWGLAFAPNGDSNSFFATMDDGTKLLWDIPQEGITPEEMNIWLWDAAADRNQGGEDIIFNLAEGKHKLVISAREPNARIDRILITSDAAYVPTGLGETLAKTGSRFPMELLFAAGLLLIAAGAVVVFRGAKKSAA